MTADAGLPMMVWMMILRMTPDVRLEMKVGRMSVDALLGMPVLRMTEDDCLQMKVWMMPVDALLWINVLRMTADAAPGGRRSTGGAGSGIRSESRGCSAPRLDEWVAPCCRAGKG